MIIGVSMLNDALEKALKLKGYGSLDNIKNDYSKIEKTVTLKDGLKVKPTVIKSLKEYVEFVAKLNTSYKNPIFYRGQGNANYPINPTVLRCSSKDEKNIIDAFYRRFSKEIDSCNTDMERLVFMQHFGLMTRALDITESPLAALYFACSPMKKFCKNRTEEMSHWGEIILFKENEENIDNLKPVHSSTVSIISSTAYMDEKFSLWQLGMQWKKDNNYRREERYIRLKDIIRRSLIVRVPQNNPRIKNQQGAFIVVNSNKVSSINNDSSKSKELTEFILKNEEDVTFDVLETENARWKKVFSKLDTWKLNFEKITPYSGDNEIEIFDTDPFDLRKLYYKENEVQKVALIPPSCKQKIIDELAKFNITEDFIYPDMDNVSNEINTNYTKENSK